ncbi:MAG: YihA family ribosome biogenesis GTP-binding protein [Hyphomicrobiales bacterium]|nr:YihA family ribosome biogenesis GTP-binding protein [Hyphomicrobiales bacterium]
MSGTPAFSDDALERGRLLFAAECTFLLGAASLKQLPDDDLPEVAFAGRSNVGKSSLINALTGRKALARTSNTPGRTQQINFFDLGRRLMVADLPGYGFAQAPKPLVERWTRLVNTYLKGRASLRRVCLLVDARHGLKKVDREVMEMLDGAAVSYQIVLTKADKIGAAALAGLVAATAAEAAGHVAAHPEIMATSARDGIGVAELRAALAALALDTERG